MGLHMDQSASPNDLPWARNPRHFWSVAPSSDQNITGALMNAMCGFIARATGCSRVRSANTLCPSSFDSLFEDISRITAATGAVARVVIMRSRGTSFASGRLDAT
jgi:hypothetical protein